MSYNMMIGYDIYDRFTMEHFPLRQSIILTTSFFFARDSTSKSSVIIFIEILFKVDVISKLLTSQCTSLILIMTVLFLFYF
jgi:hypothetical protein